MRGIGTIMALGRRGLGVSSRRNDGFNLDFSDTVVSEEALRVAREIRGERPPTLIIHGVMQRSGTNYTGQLLRLHPNLYAYPNKICGSPLSPVNERYPSHAESLLSDLHSEFR